MKTEIIQCLLTNNPCYAENVDQVDVRYAAFQEDGPKGLMLHSVGRSEPRARTFIEEWNDEAFEGPCVHAFIDAEDGKVYQTLPWNFRGWHSGGTSNNTHVGVEMCEPGCIIYIDERKFICTDPEAARASAERTYEAAVELFAMLCREYHLDPMAEGVIISHKEGFVRGIASDHIDPEHLWEGLGMEYTMDGFRKDVAESV